MQQVRTRWFVMCAFVASASFATACGGAQSTTPTTAARVDVPATWQALFTIGAETQLTATAASGTQRVISVKTTAVRALGGAQVAALVWSRGAPGTTPEPFLGPPSDVAVMPNGAVRFFFNQSDLEIARLISTGIPFGPLPEGQTSHDNGRGGTVSRTDRAGELCFEESTPSSEGGCNGVCAARFCVTEGAGVSALSGNWAPEQETYSRQ